MPLECKVIPNIMGLFVFTWLHVIHIFIDIPIRLVGSDSDPAGRVEIYHDGNYQTICGRDFDRPDLMVVCRMLGIENIP
jgi:hypothetical protein